MLDMMNPSHSSSLHLPQEKSSSKSNVSNLNLVDRLCDDEEEMIDDDEEEEESKEFKDAHA
jgi:hypothetical protein